MAVDFDDKNKQSNNNLSASDVIDDEVNNEEEVSAYDEMNSSLGKSYLDEMEEESLEREKSLNPEAFEDEGQDEEVVEEIDELAIEDEPIFEFELMKELEKDNNPFDLNVNLFDVDEKKLNDEFPEIDPDTVNNALDDVKIVDTTSKGSGFVRNHKTLVVCSVVAVLIVVLAIVGLHYIENEFFVDPNHEHVYVNHVCKYCDEEEKYSIYYTDESGTQEIQYSYFDTQITKPKLTQKEGYIASWGEEVDSETGEKTVTAIYTIINYNITYHISLDDVANDEENANIYTVEDTVVLHNLNVNGYNFVGWYSDAAYQNKVTRLDKGTTGNLDLYAKIVANQTVLSFNLNGGSGVVDSVSVLAGDSYTFVAQDISKRANNFVGWSNTKDGEVKYLVGDTFTAENVNTKMTLYAVWDKNRTIITYNANGGVGEDETQSFECFNPTVLKTVSFTKEAASLIGWAKDPTGDIYLKVGDTFTAGEEETTLTLYARWETNNNYVNFDRNGGEGTMESFILESLTSTPLPECTYTLSGSNFIGWALTSDGTVLYQDKSLYTASEKSETITLYAIWATSSQITIHFDNNGGVGSHKDIVVPLLDTVSLPTTGFSKTGLTFAGWSLDSLGEVSYTDSYTYNKRILGETITLFAIYDVNRTILVFNANGGSGEMENQEISANLSAYVNQNQFVRSGYKFKGWAYTPDGKIDIYDGAILKASNQLTTLNLYAIWERNQTTIIFERNGSTGAMKNQTVLSNDATVLSDIKYSKTNCYFVGWSLSSDGEVIYKNKDMFVAGSEPENVYLYAIFAVNQTIIHFHANGGSGEMEDQAIPYSNGASLNENQFVYENYCFIGWAKSSDYKDGDELLTDKQAIATSATYEEIDLYAVWERNVVTINYKNANSTGVEHTITAYSGDKITLDKNVFARLGYTFYGWSKDNTGLKVYDDLEEITVPGDINELNLYPLWTINKTTIRFSGNGGTGYIAPVTLNAFESMNLPECPYLKSGMHFIGWGLGTETMSVVNYNSGDEYIAKSTNEELVCTAIWASDIQTVYFYYNDGTDGYVTEEINVYTGDKITVTPPDRDKYKFLGWGTSKDSNNVTYENSDFSILGILDEYKLYAIYEEYVATSGIIYNEIKNEGVVIGYEVSEYNGTIKDIIIPGYYQNLPIMRIAEHAFEENDVIETVKIITSITEIGDYAFYQCKNLKSIDFGKKMTTIGSYAFYLTGLETLVLPDTITSIGESSFENTISLTSVTLSNSLEVISKNAFYGTEALTEITIPSCVKTIGEGAFSDSSIKTIHFSEGLEKISAAAFYYDTNLEAVTFPNSLVTIDKFAFSESGVKTVSFGTSLKYINAYAFESCASLTEVDIPTNVTFIGSAAFAYSGIKKATIEAPLTYVNNEVFSDCSALTEVILPNTIESILPSAFNNCVALKEITLSTQIKFIADKAFEGSGLTTIYYEGAVAGDFDKVTLGTNALPTSAIVYYYHEAEPTSSETAHYWHYVNGKKKTW